MVATAVVVNRTSWSGGSRDIDSLHTQKCTVSPGTREKKKHSPSLVFMVSFEWGKEAHNRCISLTRKPQEYFLAQNRRKGLASWSGYLFRNHLLLVIPHDSCCCWWCLLLLPGWISFLEESTRWETDM
jgi:hypothetical protein